MYLTSMWIRVEIYEGSPYPLLVIQDDLQILPRPCVTSGIARQFKDLCRFTGHTRRANAYNYAALHRQ